MTNRQRNIARELLADLVRQRAHFYRFDNPTAAKKIAEVDTRIEVLQRQLGQTPTPKRSKPTATERVFIHPRTGTIPNGL